MRVLLVNQFYRPDVAATGQLLADLAEGLVQRNHEVHVLCSARAYGGGGSYAREEAPGGVAVHRVKATGFGRRTSLGRLADYATFHTLAAWRALRLPAPDVCVCLTTPPFIAMIGVLLARLRGTRFVLWSMDLYPEVLAAYRMMVPGSWAYRTLARTSRWLYGKADAVVSLGEVMTERLLAAGVPPGRVYTVHNWVPRETVQPEPRESCRLRKVLDLRNEVTLLYSGNLGLGHELETAVRAAGRIGGGGDLRVLFVGDGKMRRPLQELAASLSLSCVSFHPPQPLEDLSDSLAAGDIHLVSQQAGTQGLIVPSKLYGSLAAGRPVIFIGPDDCEAGRILGESQAGIIVPPGDVDGAARALQSLVQNAELRGEMGRKARHYYERNLGRDRSVGQIIAVIEGAAARRRKGSRQ